MAACFPGATRDVGRGRPVRGHVQGQARTDRHAVLRHRHVPRSATRPPTGRDRGQGQGQARQRHGRGDGHRALAEEGDDATAVEVTTDLSITGKPAQFGRGVMQDVSDKLLQQFVACLAGQGRQRRTRRTSRRRSRAAAAPAAEPARRAGHPPPASSPAPRAAPRPRRAAAPPPTPEQRRGLDLGATVLPGARQAYWRQALARRRRCSLVAAAADLRRRRHLVVTSGARSSAGHRADTAAQRGPSGATTMPDSSQTQCGSPPRSGSMCSACSASEVAGRAARPPVGAVEQGVLHVLGDQAGDERRALGPLLEPTSAAADSASSSIDTVPASASRGPAGRAARVPGPAAGSRVASPSDVTMSIVRKDESPGHVDAPLLEVVRAAPARRRGRPGGRCRPAARGRRPGRPAASSRGARAGLGAVPGDRPPGAGDAAPRRQRHHHRRWLARLVGLAEDYLAVGRRGASRSASSTPT